MSQPRRPPGDDSPQHIGKGLAGIMARAKARQTGNTAAPAPEPRPAPAAMLPLDMAPPPIEPPAPHRNQPPRQIAAGGRVHPDKRGRLVLATALAEAREAESSIPDALSYYSPELIQATLPYSDPKSRDWIRKNGDFSLIISSGVDSDGEVIGIPYGAFPRLMLAHIITRVIETRQRRIELSSHFTSFLKEIGYTGNHKGNSVAGQRIRKQITRLLRANVTFEYKIGSTAQGRQAVADVKVAPRFELWWGFKNPEQDSLFGSWLDISEDFYNAILARPVPLRTDILKALHGSAFALDVYMWVSYRLFGMKKASQDVLRVSYGSLQAQFGTGIAVENYRLFRSELKKAFAKVAACWKSPQGGQSALRYEFGEDGVILYESALTVSRGSRQTHSEEATVLLAGRKFDPATRDKARILAAAQYTVDHLEAQYFAWIEQKQITPANLPAHFLDFVKQHIKRNQ